MRATIATLLSGLLIVSAQPPQAQNAAQTTALTPTKGVAKFGTTTQLVVVDVSVKDKSGNPIRGLKPADFNITEDGKKQEVKVFQRSDVLYLSIGEGAEGLKNLHEKLSIGRLRFLEYFDYHPHVTLAQFIPSDQVTKASEQAAEKWKTYTGPRRFLLDRVTLVQNTRHNHWRNLQEFLLSAQVPA